MAAESHGAPVVSRFGIIGIGHRAPCRLGTTGSLHAAGSHRSKQYYKLQFRMGSKQQVRYVGKNPAFVTTVQRELMQLQANTRSAQQLKRLIREANECLRKTKHQLEPLLPLAGRCLRPGDPAAAGAR